MKPVSRKGDVLRLAWGRTSEAAPLEIIKMDNRVIDIRSEGRESFNLAIRLMFTGKRSELKATHWIDDADKGLIFLRCESAGSVKLPVALDWEKSADMAWTWMEAQPTDSYKERIDHDGSDGHGFRVYNESWGKVAGIWQAICAIQPIWAWYGK